MWTRSKRMLSPHMMPLMVLASVIQTIRVDDVDGSTRTTHRCDAGPHDGPETVVRWSAK
jgi:hypothetical protein